MHKSAFTTKGSDIAFVGHWSMHFSHFPQSDCEASSGIKSLVRIKKPKVSHDPYSLLIRFEQHSYRISQMH